MAHSPVTSGGTTETRHGMRIAAIWAVVSLVADVLYWTLAGPHMPPGDMTSTASGAQFDLNVLSTVAIPVIIGVWTYGFYALVVWRASRVVAEPVNGPQMRGNLKIQVAWIGTTTLLVLSAFVFGTVELVVPAGAGGGEGPQPIWTPRSHTVLPIQVIAQQWKFTYRYPTYGGFETDQLMIPIDTTVAFHVTSLDVIHDFWAYQLGVKADANPGIDNVAYTRTYHTGRVTVRCDELCGIWHGAMYNYGHVVPKATFQQWATSTEASQSAATKLLPPFAFSYTPSANGAGGSYYPSVDKFSPIQTYGANAVSVKTAAARNS